MSSFKRNPLLGALMLGLAGISAGCTQSEQIEFASRNNHSELDLHSVIRGQSNELLDMAVALENRAKRDFPAPKRLGRALSDAAAHSDQMALNLPTLLAAQDVELAELREQVLNGVMDSSKLKTRERAINTYRKALIGSLGASAARAEFTAQKLRATSKPTLNSHVQVAQELAQDLKSARTMIAMQL